MFWLTWTFLASQYGSHPYLFSLSTVPFEQFVVFFMLGMFPNTLLNLLIGEALAEASEPMVKMPIHTFPRFCLCAKLSRQLTADYHD